MALAIHRYRVLLVSSSEKITASLSALLPESLFSPVTVKTDVSGARRFLAENTVDIVIISAPLPDDFGTRLALDICADSTAGVLLLVKAEQFSDVSARVSPFGILTLSKPTAPQLFPSRCCFCAAQGSACGAWSKRPPPWRTKWRRSVLSTAPNGC